MSKMQAIRGMHDVLPETVHAWQWLEQTAAQLLGAYGYREIRMPIVEPTALFARSIGAVTDIVEKEMYSFADRNGDSLTLRPEGTASCVRAALQHGLLGQQTQRLWYLGPMFRHERPQKGRYRQFHQIGVEAFGFDGPDLDAEQILMTARLWRDLGIAERVRLELNTLGRPHERASHRQALVTYFREHFDALDADSQRRCDSNPLRILDSKNPELRPLIENAPRLDGFLEDESRHHFDGVRRRLDAAGLTYTVNPFLVRGLDYYTNTVFEWVTDDLGAQATVCAGGRYDGLVEQLGGRATPAVGYAMGLERLLALVEAAGALPAAQQPDAYLVLVGDRAEDEGMALAERLRDAVPGLRLIVNAGGGSFKAQFKRADKSGARLALVVGEDEMRDGLVSVKPMRADLQQQQLSEAALAEALKTNNLGNRE